MQKEDSTPSQILILRYNHKQFDMYVFRIFSIFIQIDNVIARDLFWKGYIISFLLLSLFILYIVGIITHGANLVLKATQSNIKVYFYWFTVYFILFYFFFDSQYILLMEFGTNFKWMALGQYTTGLEMGSCHGRYTLQISWRFKYYLKSKITRK